MRQTDRPKESKRAEATELRRAPLRKSRQKRAVFVLTAAGEGGSAAHVRPFARLGVVPPHVAEQARIDDTADQPAKPDAIALSSVKWGCQGAPEAPSHVESDAAMYSAHIGAT